MGKRMNWKFLARAERRAAWAAVVIVAVSGLAQVAAAQKADSDIEVLQIRPNFYLIAGAGGNIGVQLGENGVVLVDTGSASATDGVLAAIKKITDKPVRFIINTSAEPEHVGGNEKLSQAGQSLIPSADAAPNRNAAATGDGRVTVNNGGAAAILAQDHVLYRMSAPTGQKSPYPTSAQPSQTFTEGTHNVFLNGEGIQTIYQPAAHSDGDTIVFFRRSDVIMAGDVIDMMRFPVIDIDKGGSIQGELDALNNILEMAITEIPMIWQEGGTVVVPGHGWLCDQSDVLEYRDMVTIVRDVIQDMVNKGMTLEQVKAADPAKEYRPRYGSDSGPWTTNMFVEAVYKGLTKKK
jgi:glyoxylase-like metal-dependent hydrolase (beta-lactamase superfamily II)